MEEPSILDYVKSKLFFWRQEIIRIPSEENEGIRPQKVISQDSNSEGDIDSSSEYGVDLKWFRPGNLGLIGRSLGALTVAILAQSLLEPPTRSVGLALFLYIIALVLLVWSSIRGEWILMKQIPSLMEFSTPTLSYRPIGLWICLFLSLLAFLLFDNNTFSKANVVVWILAIIGYLVAFWQTDNQKPSWLTRVKVSWKSFLTNGLTFSPWTLLVLAVFGITAFYRFYLLDQVPFEMFSDHAEKLLDVGDILDGQTRIFFPRNTGREAFQMYLTAGVGLLFNTGLSFLSLKIGTALCGLLTLPFIYLLGVEVANRRVGLFAMFFAGIAYWPNVISRVALRFTLYPTFTAPVLYFLVRGLKRHSRNDFILAGLLLGVGLHGYSPFRFVPIVVLIAVGLYLLHRESKSYRLAALWNLLILASGSLVIFLPLLRYALSNPAMFSSRMMTRMGQIERSYPAPPVQIFLTNLWKAVLMPFWDNGQIWVHSIPYRPALGIVSGVFFGLGIVMLGIRYARFRNWLDLFWLVSIPLLMMPSILSLAFPEENPSLNRTGGAIVVVFLIVGLAFDSLLKLMMTSQVMPGGKWFAWVVGAGLIIVAASQNYGLVFDQFANQFRINAWNTSELGSVIKQFSDSTGSADSAWVVPYPHWVDTRLVGIRAGFPNRDFALWPENIPDTVADPRPKLYLVKPEDTDTLNMLHFLYPNSVQHLFDSQVDGRDFYMVSVPPVD